MIFRFGLCTCQHALRQQWSENVGALQPESAEECFCVENEIKEVNRLKVVPFIAMLVHLCCFALVGYMLADSEWSMRNASHQQEDAIYLSQ